MSTSHEISVLRFELWRIDRKIALDPRMKELRAKITEEYRAEIDAIKAAIAKRQSARRTPAPRWPADCPQDVIDFCDNYWNGTEERRKFRIHCWTDKSAWTSYPSGGYSDNGGWHPAPASFFLISRTEVRLGRAKVLKELEGRVSIKQMRDALI